jgi:hypothetical protein
MYTVPMTKKPQQRKARKKNAWKTPIPPNVTGPMGNGVSLLNCIATTGVLQSCGLLCRVFLLTILHLVGGHARLTRAVWIVQRQLVTRHAAGDAATMAALAVWKESPCGADWFGQTWK